MVSLSWVTASHSRPADPKDPSLEQSSVISMAIKYTMMTKLISF